MYYNITIALLGKFSWRWKMVEKGLCNRSFRKSGVEGKGKTNWMFLICLNKHSLELKWKVQKYKYSKKWGDEYPNLQ